MNENQIYLKVQKGGLVPADNHVAEVLREKKYKIGDVLKADLKRIRNPKFHRLTHKIGQVCIQNIDAFAGKTAHEVIKEIQVEANIHCENQKMMIPGFGQIECRKPQSIAFDAMYEDQFRDLALRFCRYISETYWPDCTAEQVYQMAESFIDE